MDEAKEIKLNEIVSLKKRIERLSDGEMGIECSDDDNLYCVLKELGFTENTTNELIGYIRECLKTEIKDCVRKLESLL